MDFYEQAKHIRGPQTNFVFSLRLLAIVKNTAELEEWTKRNKDFS
jgi:hypothetical protein